MKFTVAVCETLRQRYTVEADSEDEAIRMVMDGKCSGPISPEPDITEVEYVCEDSLPANDTDHSRGPDGYPSILDNM